MGTIIILLIVFFIFKFVYDTYITNNTEKEWQKFSFENPDDKLVREISRSSDESLSKINSKLNIIKTENMDLNEFESKSNLILLNGCYYTKYWNEEFGVKLNEIIVAIMFNESGEVAIIETESPIKENEIILDLEKLLYESNIDQRGFSKHISLQKTSYSVIDGLVKFLINLSDCNVVYEGKIMKNSLILEKKISFKAVKAKINEEITGIKRAYSFIAKSNKFKTDENLNVGEVNDDIIDSIDFDYDPELDEDLQEIDYNNRQKVISQIRTDGAYMAMIVICSESDPKESVSMLVFNRNNKVFVHEKAAHVDNDKLVRMICEEFNGSSPKESNMVDYQLNPYNANNITFRIQANQLISIHYDGMILEDKIIFKRNVYSFDPNAGKSTLISSWDDITFLFIKGAEDMENPPMGTPIKALKKTFISS